MKLNKFMIAALFVSAIAFTACKDKEKEPEQTTTEQQQGGEQGGEEEKPVTPTEKPEVANPDADHVRVVVFYGSACSDVAVLSSWANNNTLSDAPKFTKIGEGWFQVDLEAKELTAEYGDPAEPNGLRNCKVLFGNADGVIAGDWSSQWYATVDGNGDPAEDNQVVIEGKAHLVGDQGMAAMYIEEDAAGTVIWIAIGGLQDNPCKEKTQFEQITWYVQVTDETILAAIEEAGGLYLHGPFVDGSWNGLEMTKVDANNWTITVKSTAEYQLQEGEQYNYTLAADNWDQKALMDNGSGDNRKAIDREVYDEINYMENVKPFE